jgi:hypothetical protein
MGASQHKRAGSRSNFPSRLAKEACGVQSIRRGRRGQRPSTHLQRGRNPVPSLYPVGILRREGTRWAVSVSACQHSSTRGGSRTLTPLRVLDFESSEQSPQELMSHGVAATPKSCCSPCCSEQAENALAVAPASAADILRTARSQELIDPELARVIDCWPTLATPIRAGILAMVRAATAT